MSGRDPVDDMVEGIPVISPAIDGLIAEIVALGGRRHIEERYGLFYWQPPQWNFVLDTVKPLPSNLEGDLAGLRLALEEERRQAGWEVDRLLAEARTRRQRRRP